MLEMRNGTLQYKATITLDSWAASYGAFLGQRGDARLVYWRDVPVSGMARWELFHLTDYRVGSSSAGVYWMTPS